MWQSYIAGPRRKAGSIDFQILRPTIDRASLSVAMPLIGKRSGPAGRPNWLLEVKHDGYRMIARRDGDRVRLISRHGRDCGDRFGPIVAAVEALAARPAILCRDARPAE
jgi:bifunctional non-homologous end joining protein LigD